MSLSNEYRVVARSADLVNGAPTASTPFHALMPNADATICGHVDALDVKFVKHPLPNHKYAVSCGACQVALRVERQRRGREGRERMQKRHAAELEEARQQAEDAAVALRDRAYALADALYNVAYEAGFYGTGSQDPRGTKEWEAVVEAITGEPV
jgi:hypothetical protein